MKLIITKRKGSDGYAGELLSAATGDKVGNWIRYVGGPVLASVRGQEMWSIVVPGIKTLLRDRGHEGEWERT